MRLADQSQRRKTLQQRSGCDSWLDRRGDGVRFRGWHRGVLSIGARPKVDYALAELQVVVLAGPGSDDGALCFAAQDLGFGRGIQTATEITVSGIFG
jgi:hypothetical protein